MQVEGRANIQPNVFKKKSLILTFDSQEEVQKFYRLFNTGLICDALEPAGISTATIRAKLKEMYPVDVKDYQCFLLKDRELKDYLL